MILADTAAAAKCLRDAAHELNNLCSTIVGFAILANESEQDNSSGAAYLTEIRLSAEAVAAVAKRLRQLSEELRTVAPEV